MFAGVSFGLINWIILITVTILSPCAQAQQAGQEEQKIPPGQMSGAVEVPSGRSDSPLVVWTRVQSFAKSSESSKASQTGVVRISGDSFDVQGLEDGLYTLCARLPGSDLLDPCIWEEPLQVEIREGKVTSKQALKLTMKQGVRLRLEFDDPSALLYAEDNRSGRAAIQAGLWLPNERYVPFEEARTGRKKQVFEVTVPPATGLRVQVLMQAASFEQVVPEKEEPIGYLHNPAGFGLISQSSGLKTLNFVVTRQPAQ